jgi:hypothetical protein
MGLASLNFTQTVNFSTSFDNDFILGLSSSSNIDFIFVYVVIGVRPALICTGCPK